MIVLAVFILAILLAIILIAIALGMVLKREGRALLLSSRDLVDMSPRSFQVRQLPAKAPGWYRVPGHKHAKYWDGLEWLI